ncbi:MAG: glycosyltransferase family 2 protein [Syntrophobacteraceae bacterium]
MMAANDKPFISIFIPTYNRAAYLQECLASCLQQDYADYEILVADDGSTDETPQLLRQWTAKEPRITYLRLEENSRAQRVGILARKAGGNYLLRIGDDDRLFPNVLSAYAGMVTRYKADIVYGDLRYIDSRGRLTESSGKYNDFYNRTDQLLKTLLRGCALPFPGSMVRSSLYWARTQEESYPGFNKYVDERALIPSLAGKAADYLDWVLLTRDSVFKHIGGFSAYYRIHEEQDSSVLFKNGSEESFVQRMLLCCYGLREIFPELEWNGDPDSAECASVLKIASNFLAMFDVSNALPFLNCAFEKSVAKARSCLAEIVTALLSCHFKISLSVRPEIERTIRYLNDSRLLQLAGIYAQTGLKIRRSLDEAGRLMDGGNPSAAEELLKGIIKNDVGRTAAVYDLFSRLYCRVEQFELAYQCAIYSMALSGYSENTRRNALDIASRIGRDDECRMMVRRAFIQPWLMREDRYTEQMLFGEDITPVLKINNENQGARLYAV